MMKEAAYSAADLRLRGNGHFAVPTVGEALLEFDVCSISGWHPDAERGDVYEVTVVVERPLVASYICDILIMNLLVGLAASAFWDTAAPELSSRMSISLTIILTLAAYTSTRPAPIEKAPYVTFHDWCEQLCMFLVTGISVQNVVAVVTCGGQHEEAPAYMTDMFERHPEQCSEGWCFSRKIDCQAILILIGSWACLNIYSIIWLVYMRHRTTRSLRNRLHLGRTLQGGDEEDDQEYRMDMAGSCDTLDSSDSFSSWTCRLHRCMGRCASSCCNSAITCLASLFRMLCACFFLARSVVTCFQNTTPEICAGLDAESSPHYSQAADRSPYGTDDIGVRPRPRPLDACATFGTPNCTGSSSSRAPLPGLYTSGSTPSSTSSLQPRARARACPSTPPPVVGEVSGIQPVPSPTSSGRGSPHGGAGCRMTSPKMAALGRNYSHLSD